MYDYSGEWCFSVGLPAKSGVAGCIWCVVPNKFGIAVFSPRLDENGNSVRGVQTLHEFIRRFNFHQYDTLKGVLSDGPNAKKDPCLRQKQHAQHILTDLLFAAANGDLSEIKRLAAEGADIWQADYDKRTCLHIAASDGHVNVVKYLVKLARGDLNIDLNSRDRWGHSAIEDAKSNGHEKCAKVLMRGRKYSFSPTNGVTSPIG